MFRYAALAVALLVPAAAFAQTEPGPPGPYVIDLRGVMIGVPNAGEFYPTLPESASIPGRGFGLDIGAHVMAIRVGAARLGIGAGVFVARGKVGPPDVSTTLAAVAPQVSLNFGTGDGWSYVGGGYGVGEVSTRVSGPPDTTAETGLVGTLNVGGGARWFLRRHMAFGFDVRFYRLGASSAHGPPATSHVALSVGVSVR